MADTPQKVIVDLAKGTKEYIDLTPEEIEQRAVDAQVGAIERAEREAAAQAEADAKLAAQAKLAALGLSWQKKSPLSQMGPTTSALTKSPELSVTGAISWWPS